VKIVIGRETVMIERIQIIDYAITHDRKGGVKNVKTVRPRKYIIKIPSYGVEYVSNTFAQFKENLRMLAEFLREDTEPGHQTTIFDYLF
jgi:hypothetical protein